MRVICSKRKKKTLASVLASHQRKSYSQRGEKLNWPSSAGCKDRGSLPQQQRHLLVFTRLTLLQKNKTQRFPPPKNNDPACPHYQSTHTFQNNLKFISFQRIVMIKKTLQLFNYCIQVRFLMWLSTWYIIGHQPSTKPDIGGISF